MNIHFSIIIEQRAGDRFLFFFLKYFLELCGYTVLEDRKGLIKSYGECVYTRLILVNGTQPQDTEGVIYLAVTEPEVLIGNLCGSLAENEDDLKALYRLKDEYNEEIFSCLYTIGYLFANRYTEFRNDVMRKAVNKLARCCKEKAPYLEQGSWREIYAYLYLANRVNEGMYKMRGVQYRSHNLLSPHIRRVRQLRQGYEELDLLEAEIIRNTKISISEAETAYKKLENAGSYGVRFWALYALGELNKERADKKYRYVYDDDKCVIQTELYEPSMEYFAKSLEMKTDEPRIIYKLATWNEKKALTQDRYLTIAEEQFRTIINEIEDISVGERNTLEFEYLFKTFLRVGHITKLRGKYEESMEYYRKANDMWDHLEDYSLFRRIYTDAEEQKSVLNILGDKYSTRERTFEINTRRIAELQG